MNSYPTSPRSGIVKMIIDNVSKSAATEAKLAYKDKGISFLTHMIHNMQELDLWMMGYIPLNNYRLLWNISGKPRQIRIAFATIWPF